MKEVIEASSTTLTLLTLPLRANTPVWIVKRVKTESKRTTKYNTCAFLRLEADLLSREYHPGITRSLGMLIPG